MMKSGMPIRGDQMNSNDLDGLSENRKVYIDSTRIVFLDQSSNCTGFAVWSVDYNRKSARLESAGPIWFNDKWGTGKSLAYFFNALRSYIFIVQGGVTEVVAEEYFFPMGNKVRGSIVVPKFLGVAQLSAHDEDPALDYMEISASKWRGLLGVQPDKTPAVDSEGKAILTKNGNQKMTKDYKEPVKRLVKSLINVPDTFRSNITGNDRNTPSDVHDSLGMSIAVLKNRGITRFTEAPHWNELHLGAGILK
jgi:hypothetical protein